VGLVCPALHLVRRVAGAGFAHHTIQCLRHFVYEWRGCPDLRGGGQVCVVGFGLRCLGGGVWGVVFGLRGAGCGVRGAGYGF